MIRPNATVVRIQSATGSFLMAEHSDGSEWRFIQPRDRTTLARRILVAARATFHE
jgi:hypothetical protein